MYIRHKYSSENKANVRISFTRIVDLILNPKLYLIILIIELTLFLLLLFITRTYGVITLYKYKLSFNVIIDLMIFFSIIFSTGYILSLLTHERKEYSAKANETTERVVETNISSLPFIEMYPIEEPHVYVGIVRIENKLVYHVVEPILTEEETRWKKMIEDKLYYELLLDEEAIKTEEEKIKYLQETINKIIKRYRWKISESSLDKIMYYIIRDKIGYGKVDPLMKDKNVEDISCNGPRQPIYVWHRFYESIPTNIIFEDEEELDNYIIRLAYKAGRHVSISTPIVEATLPDGTRITMTFRREVSRRGSTFTIRKFRKEPFTIVDLIKFKTLNIELASFLWYVIENMASVLVAGGTATGKTTLLNALSLFIRPEKKIVTIEDTPELQLYHENWNSLVERTGFGVRRSEAEIKMFDLLKAALRHRPDIIIVGEVRGEEAYTMFQAMATGHGALGSIHAESPDAVISRLTSEPMNVPESLILTLDLIVLITRMKIGDKIYRKVVSISEPIWDDKEGKIITKTVYEYDAYNDTYKFSGYSNTLNKISRRYGINMNVILEDLKKRQTIIEWMVKKDIRDYKSFINIIKRYYLNPEELYSIAQLELIEMGG
ncbi:type IV secretory pathway protein [Candidatus Geothermarchaeota archaeon]|nr:MAG: type IV secretory pathway protein [Candidatus Geothermarchaeota archaeon]